VADPGNPLRPHLGNGVTHLKFAVNTNGTLYTKKKSNTLSMCRYWYGTGVVTVVGVGSWRFRAFGVRVSCAVRGIGTDGIAFGGHVTIHPESFQVLRVGVGFGVSKLSEL
jgi:hypothetical protein